MRQQTIDIYDCKADKERPEDQEIIIVRGPRNYTVRAKYNLFNDSLTIIHSATNVPFTAAKEWYRPITGRG